MSRRNKWKLCWQSRVEIGGGVLCRMVYVVSLVWHVYPTITWGAEGVSIFGLRQGGYYIRWVRTRGLVYLG